jgi:hypothetical protein
MWDSMRPRRIGMYRSLTNQLNVTESSGGSVGVGPTKGALFVKYEGTAAREDSDEAVYLLQACCTGAFG